MRWVEELRGRIARGDILATMYATGEGVKKDVERARSLFDEAEANGVDVSGLRSSVGL